MTAGQKKKKKKVAVVQVEGRLPWMKLAAEEVARSLQPQAHGHLSRKQGKSERKKRENGERVSEGDAGPARVRSQ